MRIVNDQEAPNTDGIDPISSRNVFISDCYIETGDDAICLKSAAAAGACENIVVSNCVLISDGSAIKCGTASHGTNRNVTLNNILIRNSRVSIALFMKDGGVYEDPTFSGITIETGTKPRYRTGHGDYPIFIDIESRGGAPLGTIRNLSFVNLNLRTAGGNCLIAGMPEKKIEGLTPRNVRMEVPQRGDLSGRHKPRGTRKLKNIAPNDFAWVPAHFALAHVRRLLMEDIVIVDRDSTQEFGRHALWLRDVEEACVEGLVNRGSCVPYDSSLLKLQDCVDVLIRGCRPSCPGGTFVQVAGQRSRGIVLLNNDLRMIARPLAVGE